DAFVRSVDFSPDGTRAASAGHRRARGGPGGAAQVWEVPSGKPVGRELPHTNTVWNVQFNPAGETVLTTSGAGKTAHVWNAVTGEPVCTISPGDEVYNAVFSPDGKAILLKSGTLSDKNLSVHDAVTGKPLERS